MSLAGFIFVSCENNFQSVTPDYKSYPVIYSVLELQRDTLCVRVTRTFSGSGPALDYARIPDSVYYPIARVWLEKWNGDLLAGKAELVKSQMSPRKPGVFNEDPNWNYILVRSTETEPLFSGSIYNQEYHLTIEIPGLPLVFAKTNAYPAARLQSPRLAFQLNFFYDPIEYSWTTSAPYSELYFRLMYTDVYADSSSYTRTAVWREYHTTEPGNGGTDRVFGQDLMRRIGNMVKEDPLIIYRHVIRVEAVIAGIQADLYDYRLMSQIQPPDQVGFPITNINNGIGLFTSQTITAFNLRPDQRSKDSIMMGKYTKKLKFRFY